MEEFGILVIGLFTMGLIGIGFLLGILFMEKRLVKWYQANLTSYNDNFRVIDDTLKEVSKELKVVQDVFRAMNWPTTFPSHVYYPPYKVTCGVATSKEEDNESAIT